ncbi:tRNA pseudouridine(55) synthase TruB [[Clostridium] polysaccharolyticum]|uniref:tRNA pseudouridine synthase B n=1 Tax=[Clostridium] polysaccharolyticum TaxID=29364 RepID=A0A1I0AJ29_9FIRM|nr:tRNA pseudouridine(55) synthase TruB [[Clostridium] polysaccharolyticum]SES93680.1 tRNA pseudouridine55 synthase [[Clostridium] polysaccharolyticum]
MDGILNIYKEKGFTSHDVVAKLRGIVKQKKIGHTGTLDPDASGVLPVCLGKATKVCDLLTDKDKTYEAVMQLGVVTDTQDLSGKILNKQDVTASEEEIREAVMSFTGVYDQIPPMYSALKVNGKKLYELAREGKVVERKPRQVTIHKISILEIDMVKKTVTMTVECSKGTYIRTLCQDIGGKLGCGGAMAQLKRTRVSSFLLDDSITLAEVERLMAEGTVEEKLIPVDSLFEHLDAVTVSKKYQKYVDNGNKIEISFLTLPVTTSKNQEFRVYDENNRFVGIFEAENRRFLKPKKMFL